MTPPWVRKLETPSESAWLRARRRRWQPHVRAVLGSSTIGVLVGLVAADWTADQIQRHFDAVGAGLIGILLVVALVGVVTVVLMLVRRTFGPFWTSMTSIPLGALVGAFALTLFVGLIA